jgi:hypothetical protein
MSSKKTASDQPRRRNTKKFKVVEEISNKHMERLAAAFDELARKEGFDESDAFFAKDSTFDDLFESSTDVNPELYELGDVDDDADWVDDDEDQDWDDSDGDNIAGASLAEGSDADDMEARISAARSDLVGVVNKRMSVKDITPDDLKSLGYRKEMNPFGNDETPRRRDYKLLANALSCPACGADFQCSHETRPGFLPQEKYEVQMKLSQLEAMSKLNDKANSAEWTPEDEVKWLVGTLDQGTTDENAGEFDIEASAEELELDLETLTSKTTICKRCHGLQNFGTVDQALRPGWTDEPLLSQEKFSKMLKPLAEKPAVIIALVDLFDFSGSVLPELDEIAGDNPVILVANKVDLLPSEMGFVRAENWVRRELEYYGVKSLANIGGAVQLVSCKTGLGVDKMMAKARSLSSDMGCDIYLVGAANAGKFLSPL